MDSSSDRPNHHGYVDFDVEIGRGRGRLYPIRISSPAGELRSTLRFPFTRQELAHQLIAIENALLRAGQARRLAPTAPQRAVQAFGQELFDALLADDAKGLFYQSQREAELQGKGMRLKLQIDPPELAALPWEFLYDTRAASYLCLSAKTPIVRDLGLAQPIGSFTVIPPLRVLGLVASPQGLEPLDVAHERQRIETALAALAATRMVELYWLKGQTWRDLQRAVHRDTFHIFHFIGHGGFDPAADEGLIALADDAGEPYSLRATDLAMLLADQEALRLVVLNSCEGARGGSQDVFSSTAAILVRRGIPAVLAMQYEITDQAAIECARVFYEAVARGRPVDAAAGEARQAMRLATPGSLEWATPVLYQRAPDGVLFAVQHTDVTRDLSRTDNEAAKSELGPTERTATTSAVPAHKPNALQQLPGDWGVMSRWDVVEKVIVPLLVALVGGGGLAWLASAVFEDDPSPSVVVSNALLRQSRTGDQGDVLDIAYNIELMNMEGQSVRVEGTVLNARSREAVRLSSAPTAQDVVAEDDEESGVGSIQVPFPLNSGCIVVRIAAFDADHDELSAAETPAFDPYNPNTVCPRGVTATEPPT